MPRRSSRLVALIVMALVVVACQSSTNTYEKRAALVAQTWQLAIESTDASLANGTETGKALAIQAIANGLHAVDLFASTEEPPEHRGTKAQFMAEDVGGALGPDAKGVTLDGQRAALDKWTALMVRNNMPFTVGN